MGLVDEQERAVPSLHLDDLGQRRLVAVHAEHRVDRDQDARGAAVAGLAQPPLEVVEVVVAEPARLAPRHAHAVVDALVRVLVEDGDVAGAEQRGDRGDVRIVARRERGRGLLTQEGRQLVLQLVVQLERTRQQANAARGRAVALDRRVHRRVQTRVPDQTEVAVRRELDERALERPRLRAGPRGKRNLVRVQRLGQARREQVEPAAHVRRVQQRPRLRDDLVDGAALEVAVERIAHVAVQRRRLVRRDRGAGLVPGSGAAHVGPGAVRPAGMRALADGARLAVHDLRLRAIAVRARPARRLSARPAGRRP